MSRPLIVADHLQCLGRALFEPCAVVALQCLSDRVSCNHGLYGTADDELCRLWLSCFSLLQVLQLALILKDVEEIDQLDQAQSLLDLG